MGYDSELQRIYIKKKKNIEPTITQINGKFIKDSPILEFVTEDL